MSNFSLQKGTRFSTYVALYFSGTNLGKVLQISVSFQTVPKLELTSCDEKTFVTSTGCDDATFVTSTSTSRTNDVRPQPEIFVSFVVL